MNAALPIPTPSVASTPEPLHEEISLAELAPGETAVVQGVDPDCALGRRLLDLGFRPGTALRVVRRAPLGDPISYELRGSRLCLRRSEARRITVSRQPAG